MKIVAIASGGGHWTELQRIVPAFNGHEVIYVCTHPSYAKTVENHQFYAVPDASRWNKMRLLVVFYKVFNIMTKVKPDIIISTGAAPGLMGIIIGRIIGAKTVWLDSIANVDEVSLSGRLVRPFADRVYTQWPALATNTIKLRWERTIMIFIVTGTQEPFDRLTRAVDEVAAIFKSTPFIAQISRSTLVTPNLQTHTFIPPVEFDNYFDQASLIISHAGTGTIFSALEKNKPIIVMPRLAKHGEHRNDHQLATCRVFEKLGYINVAYSEEELKSKVITLLNNFPQPLHQIGKYASNGLIEELQSFFLELVATLARLKLSLLLAKFYTLKKNYLCPVDIPS